MYEFYYHNNIPCIILDKKFYVENITGGKYRLIEFGNYRYKYFDNSKSMFKYIIKKFEKK